MFFSWSRWQEHTVRSKDQWPDRTQADALYAPEEAAPGHYLGERSEGGKTASAGVLAGLERMCKGLGLFFPTDASSVSGWEARLA